VICSVRSIVLATILIAVALDPAFAVPPEGIAMILGASIHASSDSGGIPLPKEPADLVGRAVGRGLYDVQFYFFSQRPLVGAWSIAFSLDFDRSPGSGIDILSYSHAADRVIASPGWPEGGAGQGIWLQWDRERCESPDRFLFRGRSGWYLQPVVRLRVRVHGADRLALADAEPGVPAEVDQCQDEAFRLDGVDGWTRYLGAEFLVEDDPAGGSNRSGEESAPIVTTRWGELKARFKGGRP
jgi:hypothetical protein